MEPCSLCPELQDALHTIQVIQSSHSELKQLVGNQRMKPNNKGTALVRCWASVADDDSILGQCRVLVHSGRGFIHLNLSIVSAMQDTFLPSLSIFLTFASSRLQGWIPRGCVKPCCREYGFLVELKILISYVPTAMFIKVNDKLF